jgi:hypothetical protein
MSEIDPKVILAVVSTPEQLRKALAYRRHELGLKQLDLDHLSGIQSGYTGKLEAGIKNYGDVSLPAVLEALGVEMVLMRSTRAHGNLQAITRSCSVILRKNRQERGRRGGLATKESLSPVERSLLASRAAQARWEKAKSKSKKGKSNKK